jgi:hypothetical protein
MRRRQLIAGMVGVLLGAQTRFERKPQSDAAPDKVRLIPDEWHIHNAGRLRDGRLFLVDSQFYWLGGNLTWDFACTFIFDSDGRLIEHKIEFVGERNAYPDSNLDAAISRHLDQLGERVITDIRVRPFSVESNTTTFGLIPRRIDYARWRVEFMPGNTLSFYPPWEEGGYDT